MRLRVIVITFAVAAFATFATHGSASAKPRKIAVLGIEAQDDGDAKSQQKTTTLAKWLTDGLRSRATRGANFELAPNSNKELTELKLLSDCIDENTSCMSQIGRDLGAELLMYGRIEKKRDGYSVNLHVLEVDRKEVVGSKARNVSSGNTDEAGMRMLAGLLFSEVTGQPVETVLVVRSNANAGTIYVNGVPKGTIAGGTATVRGLQGGKVKVAVEAEGFQREERDIDLIVGETTTERFDLAPASPDLDLGGPDKGKKPPPPPDDDRPGGTSRALFWTSIVLTAGGVAAFTITGLQVRSLERDQETAIAEWPAPGPAMGGMVTHPDDACAQAELDGYQRLIDICTDGERMATITNVLIGVTAVTALASGWFYYKGYVAPGSSTERSRPSARKKHRTVTVLPSVSTDGANLNAIIQF